MTRTTFIVGAALLCVSGESKAQSTPDSLPPGVTRAMVAKGKQLYEGQGLCMACHGMDGKGSIGPDLTDSVWLHQRGAYAEIVTQVIEGISAEQSKSGTPMPPRGGSGLTDEELRAVAAYVWTLSRGGGKTKGDGGPADGK